MTSNFVPNPSVKAWIGLYGGKIREMSALYLYTSTRFVVSDDWKLKGFLGITVSKDTVMFNKTIESLPPEKQVLKVFHELVHVAQYRDYGWFGFLGTYLGQWIRCGFSYDNMKSKGLEKEAIERTAQFQKEVNINAA